MIVEGHDNDSKVHAMADLVARLTVADENRASLEWRFWTGSKKRTQDVYVQPRSSTYPLKISLHKDGYAQLGFLKPARDRLRDTDRQALTRWRWQPDASWSLALQLSFPTSQLQAGRVPGDARTVAAAPPDETTCIQVYIGDGSGGPTPHRVGGWADAVTLDRQAGTVFIGAAHRPFAHESLALTAGAPAWQLPRGVRHELPYGHLFGYDGDLGCATVTEYSTQLNPSTSVLAVPSWSGPVRGLRSAAPDLRRDAVDVARTAPGGPVHFCGFPEHLADRSILYVDEFARCNLGTLGLKAEAIAAGTTSADRRRRKIDIIWAVGPDHPDLGDADRVIAAVPGIGDVVARTFDGSTMRTVYRN